MRMKILITGICGFVGSTLARWAKQGLLQHDGARRERRYWIIDEDDD